jgi:glutaredoxin
MKVIVYSAEWCPWCHKVMEFLEEKGIKFEEKDVDEGTNGAEMVEASGQEGIPVTVIEDGERKNIIIGFDIPKLKKALNIKK